MTKIPNFENSRWRTAAILKIVLSLYLSRKSSDFNEIWYAETYFPSKVGYLTKYQNFANSKWRTAAILTRSSADADNRLDAFSGQSRSTTMVPFHMLHIVSYCAIVTLSLRRAIFTIFVFKKLHDLEMGVKGHSRSLRVVSFNRLCMVSY